MTRLIINFIGFWCAVSTIIYMWAHASDQQHINAAKAIIFGFVTAAITLGLLATMILFF